MKSHSYNRLVITVLTKNPMSASRDASGLFAAGAAMSTSQTRVFAQQYTIERKVNMVFCAPKLCCVCFTNDIEIIGDRERKVAPFSRKFIGTRLVDGEAPRLWTRPRVPPTYSQSAAAFLRFPQTRFAASVRNRWY